MFTKSPLRLFPVSLRQLWISASLLNYKWRESMKQGYGTEGAVFINTKLNAWKLNQSKWLQFLWLHQVWEGRWNGKKNWHSAFFAVSKGFLLSFMEAKPGNCTWCLCKGSRCKRNDMKLYSTDTLEGKTLALHQKLPNKCHLNLKRRQNT